MPSWEPSLVVRPPSTPEERHQAVTLAGKALEPQWRFGESTLTKCLDDMLIGVIGDDTIGVAALHDGQTAAINLVAVRSDMRRQGVGSDLFRAARDELQRRGHHAITAAGAGPYLWPGVPQDIPGVKELVAAFRWRFGTDVYDLTRSLLDYETPPEVTDRARDVGLNFGKATLAEQDHLQSIARDHWYPGWDRHFAAAKLNNVIVGRLSDGELVAALIVGPPGVASQWEHMLGVGVTTIGCVGTVTTYRGKGIGTALVAYASELLREAGGTMCHIGWTTLVDFYGRLGYRPWRSYTTAAIEL